MLINCNSNSVNQREMPSSIQIYLHDLFRSISEKKSHTIPIVGRDRYAIFRTIQQLYANAFLSTLSVTLKLREQKRNLRLRITESMEDAILLL